MLWCWGQETGLPWQEGLLKKKGELWISWGEHLSLLCISSSLSQCPLNSWDICAQSTERVSREIRAKINNNNNSNDSHLYIALLFTKDSLNINSTGATLGKEVGKISLRIFPILCVSRINGLKQIRNRLNEVPLVKQKSNYMIGNCNNPSQASAFWIPMLAAVSTSICPWMHNYKETVLPSSLRHAGKSSHCGLGDRRGDLTFSCGDSGAPIFCWVPTYQAGLRLGCVLTCFHFIPKHHIFAR